MLLKVGSSGDDIKKLQQKLGLDADGIFGPGTERAVKDWQDANGLDADGIVVLAPGGQCFPPPRPAQPQRPQRLLHLPRLRATSSWMR